MKHSMTSMFTVVMGRRRNTMRYKLGDRMNAFRCALIHNYLQNNIMLRDLMCAIYSLKKEMVMGSDSGKV